MQMNWIIEHDMDRLYSWGKSVVLLFLAPANIPGNFEFGKQIHTWGCRAFLILNALFALPDYLRFLFARIFLQ